jgi:hypothetical protein
MVIITSRGSFLPIDGVNAPARHETRPKALTQLASLFNFQSLVLSKKTP